MSDLQLVLLFLGLAMTSLLVVSAVNQRQTRTRLVARKLAQMKRRAAELEEMAVSLDSIVESPDVARFINDEVLDMIAVMIKLDSNSQSLRVAQENAERLADELRDPSRKREIYRLQESDAALARTLFHLNDAGRILRRRQAAGKMEISQLQECIQDLAWSHMMVAVVSHVAQGHKAMRRGDVLRSLAFYKKAQQVALQTSSSDNRRHQLIKELSELMNNRRRALSLTFMPESDYNPEETGDLTVRALNAAQLE